MACGRACGRGRGGDPGPPTGTEPSRWGASRPRVETTEMNEHKTPPVGLFIGIAICIVFLALGVAAWVEGPRYGWSHETRIVVELCLLCALLLSIIFVKY